jgi:2-oxoglutarate ferredoxin oxidoreductase subunit gamma
MSLQEIKIGGLGGQGVILAGIIIGKAAALHDGKHSTLTQAFGPEARGSACSAQVVIDDTPILYPYVTRPHYLVTMSQDACVKFGPELREDGVLIIDEDLVKPACAPKGVQVYGIPATRFAEELGRKQVLNIIMVGFFTAVTGLVSEQAARKSVADSVPPSTVELNLRAFERGFKHGQQLRASRA